MNVLIFESANHFLSKVEAFLEQDEAENNLLLGLLYMAQQIELKGEAVSDTLMGAVEDVDGNVALVVFMNGINLILSGGGAEVKRAISIVVSYLTKSGIALPGVVGSTALAALFVGEWAAQSNQTPYVKMNQRIYRLDKVNPIMYSPGKLIMATDKELELVADWIYRFFEEIDETINHEEKLKKARINIESGSLYIWQDDAYVSMAKKTRPTRNGIVLSLVYTPPEYRSNGYASSCVAALSQLLIDDGYKFCSLYTDLSNPTSNHIYSNIGYRPVQDSIMYRFR